MVSVCRADTDTSFCSVSLRICEMSCSARSLPELGKPPLPPLPPLPASARAELVAPAPVPVLSESLRGASSLCAALFCFCSFIAASCRLMCRGNMLSRITVVRSSSCETSEREPRGLDAEPRHLLVLLLIQEISSEGSLEIVADDCAEDEDECVDIHSVAEFVGGQLLRHQHPRYRSREERIEVSE